MADTYSATNLQATLWYKSLFADVQTMLFMDRFMGAGENNPIQVITDLKKGPGDTITVPLTVKLGGPGVSGDDELEGNEEEILSYDFSPTINQLRHAVRLRGKMDEKKVAYNMRADAKDKLKIWWAERIDREILSKLLGDTTGSLTGGVCHANTPTAPVSTEAVWAGGQSADGSLTSGMVFDTKVIVAAKQMALMHSPKIRPIRLADGAYKGTDQYIMIIHPYQADDLRKDPVWNQAQREANVRGDSNPLISGALGMWNGVVIYQHELCWYDDDGGSSCGIARGVLMGQQAGVFLEGSNDSWVEKSFDYGNKWGISAGKIFGVQKTKFNSKDYGLITVATAAAAASTA